MIIVTVKIPTKAPYTQQFVEHMGDLALTVRKEEGCITYNIYKDPFSPDVLFMYEEWESMDALRKHMTQPHLLEHKKKTADWLSGEVVLTTADGTPVSL
ncbi:putative quinol monooxygenase [Oleidesulfovibrio sp.]|uniref:putative quinol monooxygenase n=1 Tax=Oleidesulfovibrio sp. TaxID=2909707 RepID=UPI003A88F2BB